MNPPSFGSSRIPTALSLMIPCALVLAAADIAGLTPEAKNRRRNEILAVGFRRRPRCMSPLFEKRKIDCVVVFT